MAWSHAHAIGCVVSALLVLASAAGSSAESHDHASAAVNQHSNNWAVLVCTSRYWFNYRHVANTLSMYRTVKRCAPPLDVLARVRASD